MAKLDFPSIIERKTIGVSEKGFGTILVFDTTEDRDYQIFEKEMMADLESGTTLYKILSRLFMQSPAPLEVAVYGKENGGVDDLNEISGRDWFWLVTTNNSVEKVKEFAEFAATQKKIYAVTVNDIEDIKQLYEEVNENTFVFYHNDQDSFVAEGLNVVMSYNVGQKTGKFKQVKGVKAADVSATLYNELEEHNINTYVEKMGVLQTTNGVMLSGEYIDILLADYWISNKIEVGMMYLALNNNKISYTNQGIGMMVGVVDTVLSEAANRDMLVEGQYIINYKRREECTANEVAKRDYSHINWKATLAGAIHSGKIYGTMGYELVALAEGSAE